MSKSTKKTKIDEQVEVWSAAVPEEKKLPTAQPVKTKPSKDKRKDQDLFDASKMDFPVSKVKPSGEWKQRIIDGEKFKERIDEFRNIVYTLARDGMSMSLIANYYGVPESWVESTSREAWRVGHAELCKGLLKQQNYLALYGKNPISQIWAGKQQLGQRDDRSVHAYLNGEGTEQVQGIQITFITEKANRRKEFVIEGERVEQEEVLDIPADLEARVEKICGKEPELDADS